MDLHHETVELVRDYPVPPARVFEAYADPAQRAAWCVPDENAVFRIDEMDLRTGGFETARCGPPDGLKWTMKVVYHRVEPGEHISFTEELCEGDMLLTVALITFEIAPAPGGTRLKVTDQIVSYVGEDGTSGHRAGYEHALANLGGMLVPA